MKRRQTRIPKQWLIADERTGDELWRTVRRLPRGSGVLLLYRDMPRGKRTKLVARLRRLASARGLKLVDENAGEAVRVHNLRELRTAGLKRVPLLFLSPMFPTRSHPDWQALPRMRAGALNRLASVPVIALGGMDARRFARVGPLGFHGWAGISAWLSRSRHGNESRDVDPRG